MILEDEQATAALGAALAAVARSGDVITLSGPLGVGKTAPDVVGRLIEVDVNTYLPGDLLCKMDIATMANSVEARSPFPWTMLLVNLTSP